MLKLHYHLSLKNHDRSNKNKITNTFNKTIKTQQSVIKYTKYKFDIKTH